MIVNQARMLAYLLDHMERSPARLAPFYGLHADDVEVDTSGSAEYPVTVTLQHLKDAEATGETSRSAPGTLSAATARAAASEKRSAARWSAT